jgi:hypothetical protein
MAAQKSKALRALGRFAKQNASAKIRKDADFCAADRGFRSNLFACGKKYFRCNPLRGA